LPTGRYTSSRLLFAVLALIPIVRRLRERVHLQTSRPLQSLNVAQMLNIIILLLRKEPEHT